MGRRPNVPLLGRFLQTDPVVGGSANNYDYTSEAPISRFELNGKWWGSKSLKRFFGNGSSSSFWWRWNYSEREYSNNGVTDVA